MRKPLAALLLLAAIAPPPALSQSAAEPKGEALSLKLFQIGEETPARHAQLAQHYGEVFLAEYPLQFDPNSLIGSATPASARNGETSQRPIAGLRFKVDLPFSKPDRWLSLDTVHESDDGVLTWSGTLDGDESSLVTLSLQGETLLGRILSEGVTYILQGEARADYRLSAIDSARLPQMPEEGPAMTAKFGPTPAGLRDFAPRLPTKASTATASAKSTGGGNVRLLVLYTQAVDARNNVNLLANNIVAQFNQSLASSGVSSNKYLSLAGVDVLAPDTEPNRNLVSGARCPVQARLRAQSRQSPFQFVDAKRADYFADVVLILVTAEPSYTECSPLGSTLGRIGGFATGTGDLGQPIAVSTDTYALGDLTALHEIGHVLGGGHEDDLSRVPAHARGLANRPACNWQTMMGGYTGIHYQNGLPNSHGCDFVPWEPNPALQPVVRLPRWSNPALSYQGQPTGTAHKNMSSALEGSLMSNASNWVADAVPPPAPTGEPSAYPAACDGQTMVDWPALSGATHYRLSRSTSSNFTNPTLAYSGPTPSALINLGTSGITYLRVQACNTAGCGGYGPQGVASGYTGCP